MEGLRLSLEADRASNTGPHYDRSRFYSDYTTKASPSPLWVDGFMEFAFLWCGDRRDMG